tara:strand:+ start:2521 stop:2724 length:204 start_codon:yes stop_codon:yes gene_type:complete
MKNNKRSVIRREILNYLKKFYLNFILYKDLPVINKIYNKVWAEDMYEQLDDKQKLNLYLKIKKKKDE